jgi:lipid II:glycine glycyltransferase (peptidoglycan interpeptide bridge formation enzyme)
MLIQLNTDNHITATSNLQQRAEQILQQELKHLAKEITRVEVHLNDEKNSKAGVNNKRCLLEARVAGSQAITTEHRADTLTLAMQGAAEQLARAVKSSFDKQHHEKSRETIRRGEANAGDEDDEI